MMYLFTLKSSIQLILITSLFRLPNPNPTPSYSLSLLSHLYLTLPLALTLTLGDPGRGHASVRVSFYQGQPPHQVRLILLL